ncbi:MAG TPA: post-COAP-1 domain-containing protein [Gemmatimonadales bacterium]|jgi:hypothetical protein
MQTLRRTIAVLIFPAIAYLGAGCERTDTPTASTAVPPISAALLPTPTRWVNVFDPTPTPPGTSCLNAGYTSISAAMAAPAVPGDVIQVCPGPYTENVLVNVMNVTLLGAQAGMPVAMRTFGDALESTVTGIPTAGVPVFRVAATNVTIDGFSVKNLVVSGDAFGIGVRVTGNDAVIANNIVHMVTTPDPNGAAQAIYLENGPDRVSILGNDLAYVESNKSAKGVFVGDAASTDPSMSILIEGNSITNITSVQVPTGMPARGAYGILFNNGANLINGTNNTGLEIRNNTINNLSSLGWVHAIGLEANTPGVLVRDNSISALVSPSLDLVAVFFEANPSYTSGMVNQNNFNVSPAAYGIALHPALTVTGEVNGTCNWWGDPDGPQQPQGQSLAGAKVTNGVDFTPWLSMPAPFGACIGGQPSTPGKVTGGGQIDGDPVFAVDGVLLSLPALVPSLSDPNSRANFGFVVQQAVDAQFPTGNLEYNDQAAGVRIKATSFDKLVISTGTCGPQTHAEFTGIATVVDQTGTHTGESLTVKVDDCGTPGTMGDKFEITTLPSSYHNGPSVLIGGNIKIH